MSNEDKKFTDPKNAFLFSLTQDIEKIYALLCDPEPKKQIIGVESMCVFIQRLQIPDGEEWNYMRNLQKTWTPDKGFYTNMFHEKVHYNFAESRKAEMFYSEIFKVWRELSILMNGTYFKGWSNIAPRKPDTPKLGDN